MTNEIKGRRRLFFIPCCAVSTSIVASVLVLICVALFTPAFDDDKTTFKYWVAARSKNFNARVWGERVERECACHVYLQVRAERLPIYSGGERDLLLYLETSRRTHLPPKTLANLQLQSQEWGDAPLKQCFRHVVFNPACNATHNSTGSNSTGASRPPPADAGGSNDTLAEEPTKTVKVLYGGLDARHAEECESHEEEIVMFFVYMESVDETLTWSVEEFDMPVGCYDTGLSANGQRSKTAVLRDAVCGESPSAMLTLTLENGEMYNILLSAESLVLTDTA